MGNLGQYRHTPWEPPEKQIHSIKVDENWAALFNYNGDRFPTTIVHNSWRWYTGNIDCVSLMYSRLHSWWTEIYKRSSIMMPNGTILNTWELFHSVATQLWRTNFSINEVLSINREHCFDK